MSSSTYRLTHIHHSLNEAINKELKNPSPSSLKLLRLKKMRLAVKDRLTAMMRSPLPA